MNLLKLKEETLEHVLYAMEHYDEHSEWDKSKPQQDAKMEFRNLIDQVRAVVNV